VPAKCHQQWHWELPASSHSCKQPRQQFHYHSEFQLNQSTLTQLLQTGPVAQWIYSKYGSNFALLAMRSYNTERLRISGADSCSLDAGSITQSTVTKHWYKKGKISHFILSWSTNSRGKALTGCLMPVLTTLAILHTDSLKRAKNKTLRCLDTVSWLINFLHK